jgi:ABC-2 type transport system permease protein
MGAVLTIAARDMKGFFATPKGAGVFWFILLLKGIFFGMFIMSFLQATQEAAGYGGQGPTLEILVQHLFKNLQFIFLLAIPAFTMAAFAEEKKTQTIRLLETSPVTSLQVVLGKFLATVGLMSLVLLASAVYPAFLVAYGNPDVGVILTSYLGLFLLMIAQLAFGIWFSSMTSNQFMAFLFTMLGLFLLLMLNWIAPNLTKGGIMEDIVRYLATTEHFEAFINGKISVRSVTYFLCFTGTFLFLTNAVVDSERWR